MRLLHAFAFLLLCAFSILVPRADAQTLLHYTSDPGDYIGKGQERTITPASGLVFEVSANANHVGFVFESASVFSDFQNYDLDFAAADGGPLTVGNYLNVALYRFQGAGQPGLTFSANGAGSDRVTGQFQVLEISFDAGGNLATFAADFVQHSEGAVPASYGQIRYNSSLPYLHPAGIAQVAAYHYRVLEAAGTLAVDFTRNDGSTGPLSADYATANGTDLAGRDYTPVSGTVTWADGDTANKTVTIPIRNSGNPYQGSGTFLVKLSDPATGAQTQATVTIINDNSSITFVHFISDAGDYIGLGQERTFSIANGYGITASFVDGGLSFSFDNNTGLSSEDIQFWVLRMTPPTGGIFGVGDYPQAERYPFQDPGFAGLDLSGDGRGSNMETGNFQVLELQSDNNGNLLKFAANFEQHSEGGVPGLYGEVRYNSTVPLPTRVPVVSVAASVPDAYEHEAGKGVFKISRTGSTAMPLTVVYKLAGTAVNGADYTSVLGTTTIKAGRAFARVKVRPIDTGATSGSKIVKLRLKPAEGSYTLADTKKAQVTIVLDDPLPVSPYPK